MNLKVSKPHPMVVCIEKSVRFNEGALFYLSSDLHQDNPKARRDLIRKDFDKVIERGGHILSNGDFFCVMQGKYDPRRNKGNIRPEHNKDNYLDAVVDEAVEFFNPYLKHILFMGIGNHETSIINRLETDLLQRFVERAYQKTGHQIYTGGYHGWVVIVLRDKMTPKSTVSYKIYYNHGAGGDAAVTQGMIEHQRKNVHVEGADAIWMGHNHNKYANQIAVHYFDNQGGRYKPMIRTIENIRTGTYKQEYTKDGYHIEKGRAPKALGGAWMELTLRSTKGKSHSRFIEPKIYNSWHQPIEL